jgi:4-oxalocrotonate tautomerase family enzyme
MPLVNVNIIKGESVEFLSKLLNVTMDAIQIALQLPNDDRNIRVIEYEPYLFVMKSPYRIIVEVSMFSGRTLEAKKKLYDEVVSNLSERLGFNRNEIFILVNEQPLENWGIRGGIPASEINLDFKVNI